MSKITVRADEDLVERLDAREESKSQLVREALRAYLDDESVVLGESKTGASAVTTDVTDADAVDESLDGFLADRVADMVDERVEQYLQTRQQDVHVSVNLESATAERETTADEQDPTPPVSDTDDSAHTCGQCGQEVDDDHVYCPNCGEKASRRAFCDCGDEIRSDWAFCPGCGRRTPAAGVLDSP